MNSTLIGHFSRGRSGHRRARVLTVAAVSAALLTGACSADLDAGAAAEVAPIVPVDAVGRLAGSQALVAIVAGTDDVVAYVCDGPPGLGERFAGPRIGDTAELASSSGATLSVRLDAEGVTGTFTPTGGAPQPFTAGPSVNNAGLFLVGGQTAAGTYTAGWVVLADGSQTGTVSLNGEKSAAPKIKVKKKKRRHGHDEPSQVAPGEPVPGGQVILPGGGVEPVEPPAEIADPPGSGAGRVPVGDEPPAEIADPPGSGAGRVPDRALAAEPVSGPDLVRTVTEPRGNGVAESEADLPGIGTVEPDRIDPEDVRATVEFVAGSADIKSAPPIRR